MTRRTPAFEAQCIGRIDRDRSRARSAEQAKHIEAAAYHATQARLCRIEKRDLEAHAKGELRGLRDILTAHSDAAGASSLIASMAQQAIYAPSVARSEAERVFAANTNETGDAA